jgi:hypothetical protein
LFEALIVFSSTDFDLWIPSDLRASQKQDQLKRQPLMLSSQGMICTQPRKLPVEGKGIQGNRTLSVVKYVEDPPILYVGLTRSRGGLYRRTHASAR